MQQTPDQIKIMIDNNADVYEGIRQLPGVCKLTSNKGAIPTIQLPKSIIFALQKGLKAELDCLEQLKVSEMKTRIWITHDWLTVKVARIRCGYWKWVTSRNFCAHIFQKRTNIRQQDGRNQVSNLELIQKIEPNYHGWLAPFSKTMWPQLLDFLEPQKWTSQQPRHNSERD